MSVGAIIAIVVVALIVIYAVVTFNSLVRLRTRADESFSDIDVQLKRRHDLIPNLVETVKGYARQEQETLTRVIEARAKATSIKVDASTITDPQKFKEFQDAQNQLSGVLGRLIAITENYPDLKSNQNFLALQSQLEGTENRIAVARRDYVNAVQAYNTEVRTFPGLLWARIWGAKSMETFTAAPESQKAPQVKF